MSKCPFCEPNVLKTCFAESENFRALYNIAPIVPGHILIIPKLHLKSFLDIPESILLEYVSFSRKIILLLQDTFMSKSFNWTIQDGIPAGQTVEHMHMHIIPRYENDLPNPGDWYPLLLQKNEEMIDSMNREKISDKNMLEIITFLNKKFLDSKL